MSIKNIKIHLEIQASAKKPNLKPVGILRSSYREDGKTKHQQFGRIIGKTLSELKLLRLAFTNQVIAKDDPLAFRILQSKEYGASKAALEMIKQTGLDKNIYSHPNEPWVKDVMAMIAGRLVYQGSKLSLCNIYDNSTLWQQIGVLGKVNVEKHCYDSLDQLLVRQNQIQKKLAQAHLSDGHLILYDITSSYLEGEYEDSQLVKFGYNRDQKKNHKQIVIGLICNKEGCPVAIEVYPGNTKDETTVIDKIKEIKEKYGIKQLIFVGDRGMVTKGNLEKLKQEEDLLTISALTRPEIFELLKNNSIDPSLFDEQEIHEVIDPDNLSKRHCLCKNPFQAKKDQETRQRLITLTTEHIAKIQNYKRSTTIDILGARIGKIMAKYKMGKYISWDILADSSNRNSTNHKINLTISQEAIKQAEILDGCYIISTNVSKEIMVTNEVVASYKKLQLVEQAFRNLKTVQLEIRPVFHKRDDRIKAHMFLCMLAYYIEWHMNQKLQPLFKNDNKGKDRHWTFANVIATLKQVTQNKVQAHGVTLYQNSELTKSQKEIVDYLGVKL